MELNLYFLITEKLMDLKFSGLLNLIFSKGNLLFKNLKLLLFQNELQHCVRILLVLATKFKVLKFSEV